MIELQGVCKSWVKNRNVLHNISFSADKGERIALVGKNGAGKSTLFKLLIGLESPDSGTLKILGSDMNKASHSLRKEIGYLPENAPLLEEFTPKHYLENLAKIHEIKGNKEINYVKQECQLEQVWERRIYRLSKGYRQRVALAGAVLHSPKILILDEPTVGLDPKQIQQFRQLILKMSEDKILLFSTHVLSEVGNICNRCLFLEKGVLKQDIDLTQDFSQWEIYTKGAWPESLVQKLSGEKNGNHDWVSQIIKTQTPEEIVAQLIQANVKVRGLKPLTGNLEALFN